MQCPNCGKEALNVNGKYVCLDCGIEVASPSDTGLAPVETPQVSHTFSQDDSVGGDANTALDNAAISNDSPQVQGTTTSDTDAISAAQSAGSPTLGSQESDQDSAQPNLAPNVLDSQDNAQDTNQDTAQPEPEVSDADGQGSVKDYYLDALKESADEKSGSYDFDAKQTETGTPPSSTNSVLQSSASQNTDQNIQGKSATPELGSVDQNQPLAQDTVSPGLDTQTNASPESQADNAVQPLEPEVNTAEDIAKDQSVPKGDSQKSVPEASEETTNAGPVSIEPTTMPAEESSIQADVSPQENIPVQSEEPQAQTDPSEQVRPSEDTAQTPAGGDYFQPSAVNIAPGAQPESPAEKSQPQTDQSVAQDGFDGYSTPSGIGMGEPVVEDLSNQNQPTSQNQDLDQSQVSSQAAPEPAVPSLDISPPQASAPASQEPVPQEPAPAPAPALDDLLGQYAGQAPQTSNQTINTNPTMQAQNYPAPGQGPMLDTVMPGSAQVQNQYQNTSQMGPQTSPQPMQNPGISSALPQENPSMPGVGNIPTPESVFGSDVPPTNYEEPLVPEKPAEGKKKIGRYAIIGLLALFLVGGMIFLGLKLSSSRSKNTEKPSEQSLMFSLSEKVSKAMDTSQGMTVTFDQSLDFSKATPKTPESGDTSGADVLKLLFAGPVTAKGAWQTDKDSNLSLDAKFTNLSEKKIYIAADKATYVQGADGQWSKSDGRQITQIPVFFGDQNKGGIFYLTKVNALSEQGSETIDGKLYKKIKIEPKPDFIESVLSSSNTALAEAKYDNAEVENLEILAWVDDDGKIYRVTAKGEIGVTSDLYEGTVFIKSEAKYEYKETPIQKPAGV